MNTNEPMTMYHDLEVFCYNRACQACCGQKCVLILFRNVIIVACLLFLLLWNQLLVHCSNATKPAQFFPCLDFWELFLIVLCLRRLGWSFHEYKLSWGRQKGRMEGRKEAMNEGWKQGSQEGRKKDALLVNNSIWNSKNEEGERRRKAGRHPPQWQPQHLGGGGAPSPQPRSSF